MMSLGEQFGVLMNARAKNLVEQAAFPIAEEVAERMKQLTKEGRTFTAGTGKNSKPHPYDTPYSKKYAQKRQRAGLQSENVVMRFKSMRIERTTSPRNIMGGAELGFVEGGEIFKLHQDGTANGGKTRTIFPRDISAIPADIMERFRALIVGVMNGK